MTSYPFRILYANDAYERLTGTNSNIIGKSMYETLEMTGDDLSLSDCTSPLGALSSTTRIVSDDDEDKIVKLSASSKTDKGESLDCKIRVIPVYNQDNISDGDRPHLLQHYVVLLDPISSQLRTSPAII